MASIGALETRHHSTAIARGYIKTYKIIDRLISGLSTMIAHQRRATKRKADRDFTTNGRREVYRDP